MIRAWGRRISYQLIYITGKCEYCTIFTYSLENITNNVYELQIVYHSGNSTCSLSGNIANMRTYLKLRYLLYLWCDNVFVICLVF
jgi:hypothetical protein